MGILDRRRKGKWPSGRKILSCYGHGLKAAVVKQRLRGGYFLTNRLRAGNLKWLQGSRRPEDFAQDDGLAEGSRGF
jgi:hypothetical protein